MGHLAPELQITMFEAWKLAKLLDVYGRQSNNPQLIAEASAQIRSDLRKIMDLMDDNKINQMLSNNSVS